MENIVLNAKLGDKEAKGQLIKKLEPLIYKMMLRVSKQYRDVDELYQETVKNDNNTTIKLINNITVEALITKRTLNTKLIESNYVKDIYIRKMNNFNFNII